MAKHYAGEDQLYWQDYLRKIVSNLISVAPFARPPLVDIYGVGGPKATFQRIATLDRSEMSAILEKNYKGSLF